MLFTQRAVPRPPELSSAHQSPGYYRPRERCLTRHPWDWEPSSVSPVLRTSHRQDGSSTARPVLKSLRFT